MTTDLAANNNIVPSDEPSIYDQLTTLQKQALVMPNSPPIGVSGFLFEILGDEISELFSDITDHFIESNTSIQDQIGLKPEMVTLRGLVAELSYSKAPGQARPFVPDSLPINPTMTPGLTTQQIQQANAVATANGSTVSAAFTTSKSSLSLNGASNAYQYFKNFQSFTPTGTPPVFTKQTNAFLYFYQLWKGRMLFSVQTAYGIWQNMAIDYVRAVQSEDTKYRSDFMIRFKKIRIAGEAEVQLGMLAGRNAPDAAPITQNGIAGQQAPTTAQSNAVLGGVLPNSPNQ